MSQESQNQILNFTATKETWLLLTDSVHVIPTVSRVQKQHQAYFKEWKQMLLKSIQEVRLPVAPIDVIVNQLGGTSRVAEISERTLRLNQHEPYQNDNSLNDITELMDNKRMYTKEDYMKGRFFYLQNRGANWEAIQTTNSQEWNSFQLGRKKILLFSERSGFETRSFSSPETVWRESRDDSDIDVIYLSSYNPQMILSRCQSFFSNGHIQGTIAILTTEPSQRVIARSAARLLEENGAHYHCIPKDIRIPWFMVRDIFSPEGNFAWSKCMTLIMEQTSPTRSPTCHIYNEQILPGVYMLDSAVVTSERPLYDHYVESSPINRLYLMNQCLHILGFSSVKDTLDIPTVLERLIGMDLVMQKMVVGFFYEVFDHILDHLHNRGNYRMMMSRIDSR